MLSLLDAGLHGVSRLLRDAEAAMRLDEIIGLVGPSRVAGPPDRTGTVVADLAYDSRTVVPGSLFLCLPGARDDGHRHAPAALARGAVALVCEHPLDLPVPQLVVPSARAAMNHLASPFFAYPSSRMDVVGVTGTNGKTTITYLLDAILTAAGHLTGLIGTVETRLPGVSIPGQRTTPESVDLQRLLSRMADAAVGYCAVEVTSIGLAQGRLEGTSLRVAVFTNLTQDHLDYHGTMEAYYQAKRALFTPAYLRDDAVALVNADDPWGARLTGELAGRIPVLTYGLGPGADVRAERIATGPGGSSFRLVAPQLEAEVDVSLPLPGLFNVSNALAAAASALALGVTPRAVADGLASLERIPGRFEVVDAGQDFTVIVDYAHTPDGLARVLQAARGLTGPAGRVFAVFGCGGDRDRGKRPLMGAAAAASADVVVVTSDNPRGEDPAAIIADIGSGIAEAPPGGWRAVVDRAEAIETALAAAAAGDVVVIAGKGHEATQSFADRVVAFDDTQVASAALRAITARR